MHYRALVARIEADGTVTDLRPRKTSGALPIPDVATPEVAGTMRPDGITCHMDAELLKVSGRYAICATAAATAAKTASLDHFALIPGVVVQVAFATVNTAANPTLNINDTGAKPLTYCGVAVEVGALAQGQVYTLIFSGNAWQIIGGMAPYPIGQYTWFEDELVRPGFKPCNANVISAFAATYPQMAAYLSTTHGAKRLFASLAEYEAAHNAAWATLADGSQVRWNNIGGAAKFWWNKAADTLLMPDLTGMLREMAGLDGLKVTGVHGDMIRNIIARHCGDAREGSDFGAIGGSSVASGPRYLVSNGSGTQFWMAAADINTSRQVPTGNTNKTRAWGALVCAYLGTPTA